MRTVLKLFAIGALAVLPVTLAGCAGYTPLYAERVTASMSQIEVVTPQTRTGYFLGQDLRNSFGSDGGGTKAYKLTVTMTERHYRIGLRVDETSTRSEITATVRYDLVDQRTGKRMTRAAFTETVTYSTSSSPFTGVVSQQDAQERIARVASQRIQTDLALFFHTPPAQ
jgi:LPS-assembly lipoprotein